MAQVRVDVVSIGTLSRNLLWKETEPVRTPHATTTLVRTGGRNIIIDPGLPAQVVAARLFERAGLRPNQIDTVFLTDARPAHRAGLRAFPQAQIIMHEIEQRATLEHLGRILAEADGADERAPVEQEMALIESFVAADDKLAPGVEIFPLFGFTVGTCGILVTSPTQTILIAGDAVASAEHLLAGQVLPGCVMLEQAKESLQEVYEIADVIVPGHDNVFASPRTFGR